MAVARAELLEPLYKIDVQLTHAAVVIGGGVMSGGSGGAIGTFCGVLALGFIDNLLNQFNVQSYYQQIVKGLIILAAVISRRKK